MRAPPSGFDILRAENYLRVMKVKTSIVVDKALLAAIDELSRNYKNRSELIEAALQAYITRETQRERKAKDLEIIRRNADALNQEALDVLDYQVAL